jgi:hypothetical protein
MSARTQCPRCYGQHVITLQELLFSAEVDFFRCTDCSHFWHVQKGDDDPARYTELGTMAVQHS